MSKDAIDHRISHAGQTAIAADSSFPPERNRIGERRSEMGVVGITVNRSAEPELDPSEAERVVS